MVRGVRRISVCDGLEGTETEGAQPSSSGAGTSCTMDQEGASTGLEDIYKTLIMIKKKKRKKKNEKSIRRGERSQKFVILTIYLALLPQSACLLGISLLVPHSQRPTPCDRDLIWAGKPRFPDVL